jgi:proteasome lid subunit RPN8/RPN11
MMFPRIVIAAAKDHAAIEYPKESCGIVIDDEYIPCENTADDPKHHFRIDPKVILGHQIRHRTIQAVIHSHPNGPAHPTEDDMRQQIATRFTWGIIEVIKGLPLDPFFWGDDFPVAPLKGREFRHGVHDCFALVRDWFRVERGIVFPNFARKDEWWNGDDRLFDTHMEEAGFRKLPGMRVEQVGDCVIGKIRGAVPNHCGVFIGNDGLLHHLANRLSRVDNIGPWMKYATCVMRYDG